MCAKYQVRRFTFEIYSNTQYCIQSSTDNLHYGSSNNFVDVCLCVLNNIIILVYSTVVMCCFIQVCNRYQENQLRLQRNLAVQFNPRRNTAGQNVQKMPVTLSDSLEEDKLSLNNQNRTKHLQFIGCVMQLMYTWWCNMSAAWQYIFAGKGGTFLLFTVHVAAMNNYNDKVTVLLFV